MASACERAGIAVLNLEGPNAVVVVDDGDIGLDGGSRQERRQLTIFLGNLCGLAVAAAGLAVVAQQAVPILFASDGAGSPAKPDLSVGTVGELLVANLSQFARLRAAAEDAPAERPGRLLHDQEILLLEAAHHVGRERAVVRYRLGLSFG